MDSGSYFKASGRFLIIQRDRNVGGKGGALSISEVSAFCPRGVYTPGQPGGPWTTIGFFDTTAPGSRNFPEDEVKLDLSAG